MAIEIGVSGTLIEICGALRELHHEVQEIRNQLGTAGKRYFTVEEIAESTGRSAYTVRRWITEGRIHAERVVGTGPKGRLLIPRGEFDKLIDAGKGENIPDVVIQGT